MGTFLAEHGGMPNRHEPPPEPPMCKRGFRVEWASEHYYATQTRVRHIQLFELFIYLFIYSSLL